MLRNGIQNYAKRALLCLQEEVFWILKGAFVHSLPKSGGGAWPTCPPVSTPFAANELSSEWMQLHPVGCHNECEIVLNR